MHEKLKESPTRDTRTYVLRGEEEGEAEEKLALQQYVLEELVEVHVRAAEPAPELAPGEGRVLAEHHRQRLQLLPHAPHAAAVAQSPPLPLSVGPERCPHVAVGRLQRRRTSC